MRNKILTKSLILLMGLFLFASISPAQRIIKAKFKVTRVYATVSPKSYKGKCPFKFNFTGYITTNGKGAVKYKWIRKDGAIAPVKTIYFSKAETKKVTTSWYLGGAGKVYKNYWEAVQILSPNSITSNKAYFSLYCKGASEQPGLQAPVRLHPKVIAQQKLPDLGMYGFMKIGKYKKEVKWGGTIVLTPNDVTLISKGKPAFNVYYSYREYAGVSASGFKNKIYFNNKVVSTQSKLSLTPKQIKPVYTQAYLGPKHGKLKIHIDADNDIKESREDNNFNFFVYLKFKGFGVTSALKGKKLGPIVKKKEGKTPVVKAIPKPKERERPVGKAIPKPKERERPVGKAVPKPKPTPPSGEISDAVQAFNTGRVTVMGNNRNWTRIYGVKANYAIKVAASGIVDFGCAFGRCKDNATAGVTGNKFLKFLSEFGKSLIEITTQPWKCVSQIKQMFKKRGPVNYDQGGVWIKITDIGGNELTATQLYYYWHNVYNKVGGVCFSRDVIVWAKAHDGGRNPESTSSYGDNKGYYQVWLVLTENQKVPGTF